LKGAELFTAAAYGGFEKQISGAYRTNILRYGGDLNLYVPRVIAPFHLLFMEVLFPRQDSERRMKFITAALNIH
jgi:hypothetical protein